MERCTRCTMSQVSIRRQIVSSTRIKRRIKETILKEETYYTKRPKVAVIANHPRLFSKPRLVLGRGNSPTSPQRSQNAFHKTIAQPGEENQIVSHVEYVIGANCVFPSIWVVVRQPQKGPCEGPGSGNAQLGEVEKQYEIANNSFGSF
jgi:hypothetical protein